MEGVQKWIKVYLMSVSSITICLYHSLAGSETMSPLFKGQGLKDVKRFLELSRSPNGHVSYVREIIITCMPTVSFLTKVYGQSEEGWRMYLYKNGV